VARVPIVESIAILVVDAELRIALADIDEVGGIRRDTKSLELGVSRVAVHGESVIEEGIRSEVRVSVDIEDLKRLRRLPGVAGRRAATTTTGWSDNRASANLVWLTINNPVVEGDIGRIVVTNLVINVVQGDESVVPVLRLPDAVNALGSASRPLGPVGEDAVLLNAFELVSAFNARSNRSRANASLPKRGGYERNTKKEIKIRSLSEVSEVLNEVFRLGEPDAIDVQILAPNSGVLGVPTTIVGGGDGVTVARLNRNIAENTEIKIP